VTSMREPRVVGETTPAETAMNDLRQGVEKYMDFIVTAEPPSPVVNVTLRFTQWPWRAHVRIETDDSYVREVRIANARTVLIANARAVAAVEQPTRQELDDLEAALADYDAARAAP
jgi:hypothetical protein